MWPKTCTSMFVASFFIIALNRKLPKCLQPDKWLKNYNVYNYALEYCLAVKLIYTTICWNHQNMLREEARYIAYIL